MKSVSQYHVVPSTFKLGLIAMAFAALAACDTGPAVITAARPLTDSDQSGPALQIVQPELVGMDTERLNRVTQAMQEFVDAGQLAGVVTMAARDNKIVHFEAVGQRDIASGDPMDKDDIFRIYSMSKPITGVAMMILYEEGKFKLSDPVEKYIPEFTNLQVAAGEDANGNIISEPPTHKMTIRELMSHTGGLSYGLFSQSKVDDMYNDAGVLDPNGTNLQDMINKLAAIPLRQQPGSTWHYSVSVDVQGYLVEKLSGQKFGDFLEERIFKPLNMVDTDFHVPAEKVDRFAQVYGYGPDGELVAQEGLESIGTSYLVEQTFESGGGGLVGTAMDYMRFAQMLLNGGELDGVRILAPLTVEIMHRNQLPKNVAGMTPGNPARTFGLNFAIIEDPVEAESYSRGEYYWSGAAGTWFWIDPVEDLVFVGMIQQFGGSTPVPDVRGKSRQMVYQSILDPKGV